MFHQLWYSPIMKATKRVKYIYVLEVDGDVEKASCNFAKVAAWAEPFRGKCTITRWQTDGQYRGSLSLSKIDKSVKAVPLRTWNGKYGN